MTVNQSGILFAVLSVIIVFLIIRNFMTLKADKKAAAEEEKAKQARRDLDFKRGTGEAKPSLRLYKPPTYDDYEEDHSNLSSIEDCEKY